MMNADLMILVGNTFAKMPKEVEIIQKAIDQQPVVKPGKIQEDPRNMLYVVACQRQTTAMSEAVLRDKQVLEALNLIAERAVRAMPDEMAMEQFGVTNCTRAGRKKIFPIIVAIVIIGLFCLAAKRQAGGGGKNEPLV
jgi:hypothetical protein